MKKYIFALVVLTIASNSHAQEILLWKVENSLSPTIVPLYDGQPSPFPKIEVKKTEPVSDTLSAEAEAARKARLEALARAQKILNSKDAFKPELGVIQVNGVIQGVQGTRALISNQWVKVGQTMQVRAGRTPEVNNAIEMLRQYDADAANQLEEKLQQRYAENPYLTLKIKKIEPKELFLEGDHGTYRLPIQSGDANDL